MLCFEAVSKKPALFVLLCLHADRTPFRLYVCARHLWNTVICNSHHQSDGESIEFHIVRTTYLKSLTSRVFVEWTWSSDGVCDFLY